MVISFPVGRTVPLTLYMVRKEGRDHVTMHERMLPRMYILLMFWVVSR